MTKLTQHNILRGLYLVAAYCLCNLAPATLAAQGLSLEEAMRRAELQSEVVGIARAASMRASGEEIRARSLALPQLFGSIGYIRTLESQFADFSGGESAQTGQPQAPQGPCGQYLRDDNASVVDRVLGLETSARCSLARSLFDDFGSLPFGREHEYDLGLSLSQSLFAGGRLRATHDIARSGERVADIELSTQLAQLQVSVTESYYDAVLADRLVAIAESSLAQTEEALRQTEVGRNVGDKSEFDLLRARVTRDNQLPIVIQRRSQRDIAYLRLKQLLDIPFEASLELSTSLDVENIATGSLPGAADTSAFMRAPVRQAAEAVSVQQGQLRVQRSERLPAVNLTSQYGKVGYPSSGLPGWNDFATNWTVGVGVQMPLFTGGRLRGSELVARANVEEARLRLQRVNELAALDARATIASLRESEAAYIASQGTVEQALRAYEIAEVRFREGVSTPLELSESRILLQQAQANRAITGRNLLVVRTRLTLLRDLPLGTGAQGSPGGSADQQSSLQGAFDAASGGVGGIGGIGGGL